MNKKNKKQRDRTDPVLQLRPAFRGQFVTSMKLEGTPVLFYQITGTGLTSVVALVNTSAISNFAARFGATYEEYRFVKAKFDVRLFSSTITGLLVSWVDEKTFGVPTLAESRTKSNFRDMFNASAVNTKPNLIWTPHDPLDQQFTSIGTSTTFAAYKIYGDAVNYGANNPSTIAIGEIFPTFTIQFRGMI